MNQKEQEEVERLAKEESKKFYPLRISDYQHGQGDGFIEGYKAAALKADKGSGVDWDEVKIKFNEFLHSGFYKTPQDEFIGHKSVSIDDIFEWFKYRIQQTTFPATNNQKVFSEEDMIGFAEWLANNYKADRFDTNKWVSGYNHFSSKRLLDDYIKSLQS